MPRKKFPVMCNFRPFRFPLLTVLLSIVALGIWCTPRANIHLQLDRASLAAGEWWRLLTCHWTHFSTSHLWWDVTMFAGLGAICEWRSRRMFVGCIAISAISIPAALWNLLPKMETYRGLSGIDSALFALLALDIIRTNRHSGNRASSAAALVALLLFGGKVLMETIFHHAIFVRGSISMVPVPLAHLVGAIVAIGCFNPLVDAIRPLPKAAARALILPDSDSGRPPSPARTA